MINKVKIIEKTKGCTAYDCDVAYYINLKKGEVVSDHIHDSSETLFLMQGEAEMTIGDKMEKIKAPSRLTIPSNKYHKFKALTDLIGLELK